MSAQADGTLFVTGPTVPYFINICGQGSFVIPLGATDLGTIEIVKTNSCFYLLKMVVASLSYSQKIRFDSPITIVCSLFKKMIPLNGENKE